MVQLGGAERAPSSVLVTAPAQAAQPGDSQARPTATAPLALPPFRWTAALHLS